MNRLLGIAGLSALLAGGGTFFLTKAVYERGKLRAETETAQLKEALATSRAELLVANARLNDSLLEKRDAELARLDAVDRGLDEIHGFCNFPAVLSSCYRLFGAILQGYGLTGRFSGLEDAGEQFGQAR